jgi:putative spermidine/putrescine transport system permease protein
MTNTTATAPPRAPRPGPVHRLSAALFRHPRARLVVLATPPMLWLVVAYLAALAALLITAFYTTDSLTGHIIRQPTLVNFQTILHEPFYRILTVRTVSVAVIVTVIDAFLAIPFGLFLSKVVSRRWQGVLVVAMLVPLWASYLVKAYAWRTLFELGGVLDWMLKPLGLHGPGFGMTAVIVVECYLWFPYMVVAVFAGYERLPNTLLEASSDLGAKGWRTFRSVVLPMVFPAIVAGSVFTFSLTLGDYIAVSLVGGQIEFLGNVIYSDVAGSANQPLGAALSMIPITLVLLYLFVIRRSGALSEL